MQSKEMGEGRVGPWSRRGFLKTLAVGGAVAAGARNGTAWSASLVAAVKPSAAGTSLGFALVRLRLADFPPLLKEFGSVRLGFTALNVLGPVPAFILTRDGTKLHAVSSECTHAGCTIPVFGGTAKVSQCPCHGSAYSPDGAVIRGPATFPLTRYPIRENGDGTIALEMSEFPEYDVTVEQVVAGGASRVGLTFFALRNVEYEVFGATGASGPWEKRTFASTETGAATRTSMTGNGVPTTVYVEKSGEAGLFSVGARVKAV